MAALVIFNRVWAVEVVLVVLVLSVPGIILLRALRVPGRTVAYFPALIPCASIIVLLGSGLVVDLAGPVIGLRAPLRSAPVLVCLEIICLILLALSLNASRDVEIPWRSVSKPGQLAWPLILPSIAVIGALRLNNGHGNGIAVVALFLCIVALVVSMVFASRIEEPLLAMVLYSVALAMMWSYSLRGSLVFGFDIATEYQRLNQTVAAGVWHLAHHNDAYGAMLSVTIVPAELHFLSGTSTLLVFKAVFPVIGALFPLEVFGLARRVLSRSWAFAAAAFTLAQLSFSHELPALARQEVALVFFAALIAVMLSSQLPRGSQWALVVLLALAMVLSHYSTTYVAITLTGLSLPLQWILSFFRDIKRFTGAIVLAFVVSVVGAIVWYGPLTRSESGLQQIAQTVTVQGLDLLPSQSQGGSPIAAYFDTAQPTMSAARYEQLVYAHYKLEVPSVTPLPDAGLSAYALRSSAPSTPPVKSPIVYKGINLGSLVSQQLLNLLGVVGALIMILRKGVSPVTRHLGLFGLAAAALLVLVRLSGTLAAFYNVERTLLQVLCVFSVAFCWSMQNLAGVSKGRQAGVLLVGAAFLGAFAANTSGFSGAVLGGGVETNLANSGEDFERFYMTTPELASASWLGRQVRPGQLVYADEYAQLPLVAMTGISNGVIADVTPLTINQEAWIYASRTNVVDKRARVLFDNDLITYVFPAKFLSANFNLVYTDGSSEVFHR
jgi:uncharacterized membrane protein